MHEATTTGQIVIPTGRVFKYEPTHQRGDIVWPRTTILNYAVQGLGADLMMLARISAYNRIKKAKLQGLLISSVHDSIVVDCPDDETEEFCKIFQSVFNDVPANFERIFKHPFNLPMKAEVLYGPNLSK
jgi:DNA polymerase I-like protein with 3'-5' exonuclease and polymerase domains